MERELAELSAVPAGFRARRAGEAGIGANLFLESKIILVYSGHSGDSCCIYNYLELRNCELLSLRATDARRSEAISQLILGEIATSFRYAPLLAMTVS